MTGPAAGGDAAGGGLLLEASGISHSFVNAGGRFTLVVERFLLAARERVAVVGPSGCGKSTLLGLLGLALPPDPPSHGQASHGQSSHGQSSHGQAAPREPGRLCLDGQDALALWRRRAGDRLAELRGEAIGFVPQTGGLLPFLTLRENILLCQRITGRLAPRFVADLAACLGIAAQLESLPAQVAVGQRQRAAVARALAHRPRLLLADEPTASVHPTQADQILDLLSYVAERTGAGLVIATHDAARATAAGFRLAPCRPDATEPLTRLAYPGEAA